MQDNIAAQRKAAILLASLDPDMADALIEQMPLDEARQVRDLLMSLEDVSEREQDAVIQEFFRAGGHTSAGLPEGVELDPEFAQAERNVSAGPVAWPVANADAEYSPVIGACCCFRL